MIKKRNVTVIIVLILIITGIAIGTWITKKSNNRDRGIIKIYEIDQIPENFITIEESDLEKYPTLEQILQNIEDGNENSLIQKVDKTKLEKIHTHLEEKNENKYGTQYFFGVIKYNQNYYEIELKQKIIQ